VEGGGAHHFNAQAGCYLYKKWRCEFGSNCARWNMIKACLVHLYIQDTVSMIFIAGLNKTNDEAWLDGYKTALGQLMEPQEHGTETSSRMGATTKSRYTAQLSTASTPIPPAVTPTQQQDSPVLVKQAADASVKPAASPSLLQAAPVFLKHDANASVKPAALLTLQQTAPATVKPAASKYMEPAAPVIVKPAAASVVHKAASAFVKSAASAPVQSTDQAAVQSAVEQAAAHASLLTTTSSERKASPSDVQQTVPAAVQSAVSAAVQPAVVPPSIGHTSAEAAAAVQPKNFLAKTSTSLQNPATSAAGQSVSAEASKLATKSLPKLRDGHVEEGRSLGNNVSLEPTVHTGTVHMV
jgi:hypothetical protein